MQRKISVGSGGTAAYFGKRSGPGLGSWHQSPTLSTYSRDATLAVIRELVNQPVPQLENRLPL